MSSKHTWRRHVAFWAILFFRKGGTAFWPAPRTHDHTVWLTCIAVMLSTQLAHSLTRQNRILASRNSTGGKTATGILLTRFSCCGSKAERPLCKICTHKTISNHIHDHPNTQRLNHSWELHDGRCKAG